MRTMTVKTILLATDFSPSSAAAFDYALWLAKLSSAHLLILHVMERSVYALDFAMTHPDLSPEVKQRTGALLREWVERAVDEGVSAERTLLTGIPWTEICREATSHKADLIVMGTHGRTGVTHVMLGSIAGHVVRLAPCPVLTVKAEPRIIPSVPVVGSTTTARAGKRRTARSGVGR